MYAYSDSPLLKTGPRAILTLLPRTQGLQTDDLNSRLPNAGCLLRADCDMVVGRGSC